MKLPLSPKVRRVLAALTLGGGVWLVGSRLAPHVPRDVDVQVRLGGFRDPPSVARGIAVTFIQNGEAIRTVDRRFQGPVPVVFSQRLSIPEGRYQTTVSVEMDGHTAERTESTDVSAGGTVLLAAPIP